MSSTPRLRSGFPSTPTTVPRRSNQYDDTPSTVGSLGSISSNGASTRSYKAQALPQAPEREAAEAASSQPLIPLTLIDAPQQRLYAFGVYVVLWGWKLFDWLSVIEEGEASWWLFLKWFFIDFGFLFGLPELRIPWLELSQPVVSTIVAFHAFLNYMLMFNIQVRPSLALLALLPTHCILLIDICIRFPSCRPSLLSSKFSTIVNSPSRSIMSRSRIFSTTTPSSWASKSSTSCRKARPF